MIRWTNPQGFNLLPLLPGAAPEPGLSLKLGRDHSDYLQSCLNVSTGPPQARNKGCSFKESILRELTLYKTDLTKLLMMMSQVQRDRSSFAEPCYVIGDGRLCIFYKARTLHTNCVRAHMAEEEHTASLTGGERMADDDAHIHGQVPQV